MPGWRRDPRPPWRRTRLTRTLAGYVVEVPRGRDRSPAAYGRDAERQAAKELARRGYTVTRSHLSRGGSDLVGVSATETVQVQVKATTVPERLRVVAREGLRDLARMGTGARRCLWVYVKGYGLALELELLPDGAIVARGKLARRWQEDERCSSQS